mmetsp:Transcript_2943/g.11245  ORF Transcript_2943/g.11245 Transcript_2943/m.11245 type:complete len:84 (-) Transcript_2943:43-294(-)
MAAGVCDIFCDCFAEQKKRASVEGGNKKKRYSMEEKETQCAEDVCNKVLLMDNAEAKERHRQREKKTNASVSREREDVMMRCG